MVLLIIVVVVIILAGIAIPPGFVKARRSPPGYVCLNYLRQIDAAKESWAMENKKTAEDAPTAAELFGPTRYINQAPVCPAGGTYSPNPFKLMPTCSVLEHTALFVLSTTNYAPMTLSLYAPQFHCSHNLQYIEVAKQVWAKEQKQAPGAVPRDQDLFGTRPFKCIPNAVDKPVCPAGGQYTLGPVGTKPRCSIPGHTV